MKRLLSIILLAAALAAAPAAGQTIKSLGYNTTNGNIVAATNVIFTNSVGFATNAQSATRTNLGLGWSALTNTNAATSLLGFTTNGQVVANTGASVLTFTNSVYIGGSVRILDGTNEAFEFPNDAEAEFSYAISFLNTNAAATTRTNLGLGATNAVGFRSVEVNDGINAGIMRFTNISSGIQFLVGGATRASISGTSATFSTNVTVGGTLAVSNAATFSTNVTVNGNLSVGSLTTTTPSTWALDATQTAAATNGVLTLPSNANVIRLTNNNAISSVTNGVLGAFYFIVNQATNAVTISNVGGITVDGAQNLTLSPNESATLVATGATNASVANRGDLNNVTLTGDTVLSGVNNTMPNATNAASASSLMTRSLSDARYGGPFYYAIAKTDVSVTNSTNVVTAASVTLPTGWYHFEVFWRSIFSAGGSIRQRFWNKSGTTSFGTVLHYQHHNISSTISYAGITRGAGFETNQGVFNLYGFVNITSEAELVIEFAQNSASTNTATIYGGAGMIFRKVE